MHTESAVNLGNGSNRELGVSSTFANQLNMSPSDLEYALLLHRLLHIIMIVLNLTDDQAKHMSRGGQML